LKCLADQMQLIDNRVVQIALVVLHKKLLNVVNINNITIFTN
jgi:hypothetical protein